MTPANEIEQTTTVVTEQEGESLFADLLTRTRRAYTPATHDDAWRLAEIVAESRLYGIPSAAAAYIILMTGADLGLSQSQALKGIRIFRGVPCPSADTLVAVVMVHRVCDYFREIRTTDTESTWEAKRHGSPARRYTFSIAQAERAGLLGKNTPWASYPDRMLRARAKAFLARDVFPDVTLGLQTQEEQWGEDLPRELPAIATAPAVATVEPAPKPRQTPPTQSVQPTPQSIPDPESPPLQVPDPIPPVPKVDPEPWQERMRKAFAEHGYDAALQVGKDVAAADKSQRQEALGLLAELKIGGGQ